MENDKRKLQGCPTHGKAWFCKENSHGYCAYYKGCDYVVGKLKREEDRLLPTHSELREKFN